MSSFGAANKFSRHKGLKGSDRNGTLSAALPQTYSAADDVSLVEARISPSPLKAPVARAQSGVWDALLGQPMSREERPIFSSNTDPSRQDKSLFPGLRAEQMAVSNGLVKGAILPKLPKSVTLGMFGHDSYKYSAPDVRPPVRLFGPSLPVFTGTESYPPTSQADEDGLIDISDSAQQMQQDDQDLGLPP